jgi:hypothetical protein
MTTFYCLRFDIHPTWSPGPRIYIPQEEGGPVIPPGTGFPFRRFHDSQGYGGGNSNPPPHSGGPICCALMHKFEADGIQTAQQTFEEVVICVLH